MVYIKFDVGSRSKGYAIDDSDFDYVVVTKCSEDQFLKYLDNRSQLVNRHDKTEDGHDCTYIDIYTALMGIYKGTDYHLGVFTLQKDIVDENGLFNIELFKFIRELTILRMPIIAKTMCQNYNVKKMKTKRTHFKNSVNNPKNLLAVMYNVAYVQRWLQTRKYVTYTRLPELLGDNKQQLKIYESLMLKRINKDIATDEEIQYMQDWQMSVWERLEEIPELPDRFDVRKVIALYMLNMGAPVIETKLLSIPQLQRSVSYPLLHDNK